MKPRGLQRLQAEEGSSMVEFALVAVMFILVLLGVVEMGRMVLVYTTLAESARAGARYAIVNGSDQTVSPSGPGTPCTCTQIKTIVKDFASAGALDTSGLNITVSYPDGTNIPGSRVTVNVAYTYDPLVRYFNSILNVTMSSNSQGVITY
jgi:Flp pilus assembly protein TadG